VFTRLGARDWLARASSSGADGASAEPALAARLSTKELPVALLVTAGATDRAVADELFISTKTVSYHLGNIYRKLGVRNRTQLAALLAQGEATQLAR
jgi:DNA-binding CsgD family transcriptional regulator